MVKNDDVLTPQRLKCPHFHDIMRSVTQPLIERLSKTLDLRRLLGVDVVVDHFWFYICINVSRRWRCVEKATIIFVALH